VLIDEQNSEIMDFLNATVAHCLVSGLSYIEILAVGSNGIGFCITGGDRSAIKDEPDDLRYN
jgi:hypothetical protein